MRIQVTFDAESGVNQELYLQALEEWTQEWVDEDEDILIEQVSI